MIPQEADQTHIEYGFPVMRPRLKCRNLMRYSERVQLDRDLLILEKALNGKVPDFDPSED